MSQSATCCVFMAVSMLCICITNTTGCIKLRFDRRSGMWSDFILKWTEVKWREVSYVVILGDKIAMYITVNLYWGYVIILWLFHLGVSCTLFVLTCTVVCFNLFCKVWVCVCVGVLVICVLVFTVFCIVCTVFFVLFPLCIFLFVLSVLV